MPRLPKSLSEDGVISLYFDEQDRKIFQKLVDRPEFENEKISTAAAVLLKKAILDLEKKSVAAFSELITSEYGTTIFLPFTLLDDLKWSPQVTLGDAESFSEIRSLLEPYISASKLRTKLTTNQIQSGNTWLNQQQRGLPSDRDFSSNIVSIGDSAVNPMTVSLIDKITEKFIDVSSRFEYKENEPRSYSLRLPDGTLLAPEYEESISSGLMEGIKKDCGYAIKIASPYAEGRVVYVLIGARTLGTYALAKVLCNPKSYKLDLTEHQFFEIWIESEVKDGLGTGNIQIVEYQPITVLAHLNSGTGTQGLSQVT